MTLDKTTKYLIIASVTFLVLALLWHFLGRHIPWSRFPLGRLPGDISIKKGNSSFYFPIVTCILLSLLFSIIMGFFRK